MSTTIYKVHYTKKDHKGYKTEYLDYLSELDFANLVEYVIPQIHSITIGQCTEEESLTGDAAQLFAVGFKNRLENKRIEDKIKALSNQIEELKKQLK
jgi:hypothetical protein